MQFKKILLSMSGIGSLLVPAIAVSCGGSQTPESGYHRRDGDYVATSERVAALTTNSTLTHDYVQSDAIKAKKLKFTLITDTGNVTDKSFNQSAWEALNAIGDQTQKSDREQSFEFVTVKPTKSTYQQSYSTAVDTGTNVLVLPGFAHGEEISKFIKANKTKLQQKKVVIIGIDFTVETDYEYFYALNFDVNQASWQLGYALSKYLSTEFASAPDSRKVATLGGGAFFGVTDFITGYLKGIKAWNDANPTLKTKHADSINLTAGFEANNAQNSAITNMLGTGAKIVYPVAGPATTQTVQSVTSNEAYRDKLVVGVDVDQSKAIPASSGYFATSVLKNIAQATYDIILAKVFGIQALETKISAFKQGTKNNYYGGFAEGWVGLAPSTIADTAKRAVMQAAIEEAKTKFNALSAEEKKFVSEPKATKDAQAATDEKSIKTLVDALLNLVNQ
ncbi:sugar ABC transporter substrate-binding protein [Mycoplasmopsis bovirhinis]|uniref:BMP family ABC transporter substrate-binding protein n=1 Tax=Mycoplasmopsis bovirhinis TaxID=29553 RepID=UPI000BB9C20B|nr:BMP family ABC transporter substrate-binding protein [Mycoplasmopsis bovirhinis]BBA22138.1 sugar ABC transporter substrate-binding protein [Mycoplasmopsis bovirhinis]